VPHDSPHAAEHETPGHRHEQPEDWGWHGEFGKWARVGGWVSAALLVGLNFTTRYSRVEVIWLDGFAALLVLMLGLDWYRRKNAWRS
jgi:Protein of unknown function (DUF2631)